MRQHVQAGFDTAMRSLGLEKVASPVWQAVRDAAIGPQGVSTVYKDQLQNGKLFDPNEGLLRNTFNSNGPNGQPSKWIGAMKLLGPASAIVNVANTPSYARGTAAGGALGGLIGGTLGSPFGAVGSTLGGMVGSAGGMALGHIFDRTPEETPQT